MGRGCQHRKMCIRDRCGTEQVFRQGNYAEGNEGPDHQAAGRLEGPAEGTRKTGEENRTGKVS